MSVKCNLVRDYHCLPTPVDFGDAVNLTYLNAINGGAVVIGLKGTVYSAKLVLDDFQNNLNLFLCEPEEDCSDIFTAACDRAVASKFDSGIVYILPGVYHFEKTVQIPQNCCVVGSQITYKEIPSTVFYFSNNTSNYQEEQGCQLLNYSSLKNICIKTFEGDLYAVSTIEENAIIENCYFEESASLLCYCSCTIDKCSFEENIQGNYSIDFGLWLGYTSDGGGKVTISECNFLGESFPIRANQHKIDMNGYDYIIINNIFAGVTQYKEFIKSLDYEGGSSIPYVYGNRALEYEIPTGRALPSTILSNYLLKTGGTLTGSLILNGDPTKDLEAATKQYVDKHGLVYQSSPSKDALIQDGKDVTEKVASLIGGDGYEIGDIRTSISTNLGDNWLLCNGAVIQTSDYPELAKMTLKSNDFEGISDTDFPYYTKSCIIDEDNIIFYGRLSTSSTSVGKYIIYNLSSKKITLNRTIPNTRNGILEMAYDNDTGLCLAISEDTTDGDKYIYYTTNISDPSSWQKYLYQNDSGYGSSYTKKDIGSLYFYKGQWNLIAYRDKTVYFAMSTNPISAENWAEFVVVEANQACSGSCYYVNNQYFVRVTLWSSGDSGWDEDGNTTYNSSDGTVWQKTSLKDFSDLTYANGIYYVANGKYIYTFADVLATDIQSFYFSLSSGYEIRNIYYLDGIFFIFETKNSSGTLYVTTTPLNYKQNHIYSHAISSGSIKGLSNHFVIYVCCQSSSRSILLMNLKERVLPIVTSSGYGANVYIKVKE